MLGAMARSSTLILSALFVLLLAAAPAPAAVVEAPPLDPAVFALEKEGEEEEPEAEAAAEEVEEEFEEECEELEEGLEECEEVESQAEAARSHQEECLLRSARAHASLDRRGQKLKLTIGYTTYEPAKAKIKVGHVATLQRHLGRSGVLRVTKKLRAKGGKRLVITIKIPSARNAGCPSRRLVLFPR
jgi:hypothetical protein